jgi:CobQ/CobB/MinD/ParA nucleotide binding domain
MNTKKRIIMVLNAKGGVGKSFFAVNLVQFLKDQNQPHVAIDTDNANSSLKRAHPEAVFVNLDKKQEMDAIFTSLDVQPLVVVDGRAASTDQFLAYFDEVGFAELLGKLKASLTVIIPISHDADAVGQVQLLSEVLSDRSAYVVVKNYGLCDDFRLYDESQTRKKVVGELRAKEIMMPPLYGWLVAKLNAENLTVSQGGQSDKCSIIDRQRLLNWQRRFNEQLQSAQELLLL